MQQASPDASLSKILLTTFSTLRQSICIAECEEVLIGTFVDDVLLAVCA